MVHLTTENLIAVLEARVSHNWRASMASIGASEHLAYKWLAASKHAAKDDDVSSIFFLEHRGVWDYWNAHARRSRAEALIALDSTILHQALSGIEIPILDSQGRQLWKENPATVGKDDDTCDLEFGLGNWSRILRDPQGRAVPLTKTERLPGTVINKVLDQIPGYRNEAPSVHVHNNLQMSAPLRVLRREAARPGEPLSLPAPSPAKEDLPIVRELRERLKAASDPNRKTAKPDPHLKPVEIMGRATGDKPDQVSTFPADVPQTLADHPRAYTAEPTLVPAPPKNYARRLSSGGIDQAGMGKGPDPSLIGKSRGFRVS